MKQPLEVLKFSRMGINTANQTQQALRRIASHVNRAFGSFKGIRIFENSDQSAKSLAEVLRALKRLRAALDGAAIDISTDIGYYAGRIREAEATIVDEVDAECVREHSRMMRDLDPSLDD